MSMVEEVLNERIEILDATKQSEERNLLVNELRVLNDIVGEENRKEEAKEKLEYDIFIEENRRKEIKEKLEYEKLSNRREFIKDLVSEGTKTLCFIGGAIVVLSVEKDGFIKTTFGKLFANKLPIGKL